MKKNGGLILAAGLSSRMGTFKPLLKIGDKSFIEHIIYKFEKMDLDPIVVVAGHNYDLLREKIKNPGIIFIKNEDYDKTDMFYSIKLGLSYLEDKCQRVFISPCDNPLFEITTMKKLLEKDSAIIIPISDRPGHPILIKNDLIPSLLEFDAKEGLKSFLDARSDKAYIKTDDSAIDFDADYFSDYERILDYYNSRNNIRSLYFLRHGDIEKKTREKIYYSRRDFELSELGKLKLKEDIEFFKNIDIEAVYSSPLKRCRQGASIFKEENKIKNFYICDDLLEINLGDWEGKTFSHIKENYPEDFKLRGEDENFKPNGGESLRMVYERFSKVCDKIIENSSGNLVIFCHKGLIQSFLAENEQKDLLKAWSYNISPGSITRFDLVDGKLNLIYYGLLASDYPSDLEIRQIYKDLDLEENIIKHMINVMNIAKIIAGHMKEKGYKLDLDLLRAAALLHDIKRKEKRHEIKSANYVEKLGYPKTAKLIASHNDYRENVDRITESDILYLADKYSLEDNFVSIDERFNRSLAKCKTEEALYFHNKRYEFAKKIEEIIKLKAGLDYKTICKELNKDYEKFIGKGN